MQTDFKVAFRDDLGITRIGMLHESSGNVDNVRHYIEQNIEDIEEAFGCFATRPVLIEIEGGMNEEGYSPSWR